MWITPTTINLARWGISGQELGQLIGAFAGIKVSIAHFSVGFLLTVALLFGLLRMKEFRSGWHNIVGGTVVGLAIVAGWAVTAGPLSESWGEYALLAAEPPIRIAAQSFTFVSPMGDTVNYLVNQRLTLVSFGMISMIGVILGSLAYALVTAKFRLEWFTSVSDFAAHVIGGALMGIGGVLAMGCTIGQGVTGVSTLALGSMLALASMIFGSAVTLKIQYYVLDGRSVVRALRLVASDLRLLPKPKAV